MTPATATSLRDRVAGAPISWGVCEVPGWGHQLDPAVVLGQMGEVGLAATEFGPDGFLPDAPEAKATVLRAAGLRVVFTPYARLTDRAAATAPAPHPGDRSRLKSRWGNQLARDPYYNEHFVAGGADHDLPG